MHDSTVPTRPDDGLTDDQIVEIRASSRSAQQLAEEHRISVDHVRRIIRGLSRTESTAPPRLLRPTHDDLVTERWAATKIYPAYEVSDLGRVRRSAGGAGALTGRILRASHVSSGHFMVTLYLDGKRCACFIHDLVLETFVGPCPPGMHACHGRGGEDDDRLSNLRWDAPPVNEGDLVGVTDIARRLGLHPAVVSTWRRRGRMPAPSRNEYRNFGWSWERDIMPWLKETHRLGELASQPGEIWACIVEYPWYEVSTFGRVRRIAAGRGARAGRPLSPRPAKGGYKTVAIYTAEGKRRDVLVHHLVLETFISHRPDGMETCHNNSNPADNRLENLRWDTHESNMQDRVNARLAETCGEGHILRWIPNGKQSNGNDRRALICVDCRRAKALNKYHAKKSCNG